MMNKKHAKALKFLCIIVLLLFGAPKINIKLGPIPLYLIDVFILLTTGMIAFTSCLDLSPTNTFSTEFSKLIFGFILMIFNFTDSQRYSLLLFWL